MVTERLRLRPYTLEDASNIHSLLGNALVMRYVPRVCDEAQSLNALERILASYQDRGYSVLAVERGSDGEYMGHVGLLHWDDVDGREDVEVAYMLLPAFWGQGYATEAATACRDWAFINLGVDRVVSFIAVDNQPSIAVAERNGMRRTRRLEENRFGRPVYVYAIQKDEWYQGRVSAPS